MRSRLLTGAVPVAVASAALIVGCGSAAKTTSHTTAKQTTRASTSGTTTSGPAKASASMHPTTSPASDSTSTDVSTTGKAGAPGTMGPEGVTLEAGDQLAPAATTLPGKTIDGIQCAPIEQLAYHIHAHLQVYVDGQPRTLPAAIGMIEPIYEDTKYGRFYGAQKCYYWLHTHTTDGIIHIESPTARTYTLGDFFNEWDQPLSGKQVAGAKGTVSATVNGKPWSKSPRAIPLKSHAVIQLAVGGPVPPFHKVDWSGTGL